MEEIFLAALAGALASTTLFAEVQVAEDKTNRLKHLSQSTTTTAPTRRLRY